ncbi:MAG: hypothetical protein KO202_05815 [Methanobacteriaceae archaeon]|nr:hypothetical protein [Methanobacteriaceae archaeon]
MVSNFAKFKTLQHDWKCPECERETRLLYDHIHDEKYCINCGLVLEKFNNLSLLFNE